VIEGIEVVEAFPFAATVAALHRVRYIRESDLSGQRPYDGMEIRRVFLVRQGSDRLIISVLDAECDDPRDSLLGILRPVQRYVLQAGLDRARRISERLVDEPRDEWGYVRIKAGRNARTISVTPPVLEELHFDEFECGGQLGREFILCDGNHRVVDAVWNRGRTLPAVAVLGPPRQPFYGHPCSFLGWGRAAANVHSTTPDRCLRYTPREVDLTGLDERSQRKLGRLPETERHRRYFRDLATGFGYIGGQGGHLV
jgi:hypothetical protein